MEEVSQRESSASVTGSSAPTHQQVFWFDVSVHNVEAVEVFDSTGQIVEHAAGVPLRVSVGRRDGVEKISSLWMNVTGQKERNQSGCCCLRR